jgi:phosphoribosylamine---glycine ligase
MDENDAQGGSKAVADGSRATDIDSKTTTAYCVLIMKMLVIGGGGREHALAWKLRQSAGLEKLWCAPGNGGIEQAGECIPANTANVAELADLAARLGADLTVVGPEQPLVLGIADEFARRGLRLLGPSRQSAQLEGSKIFAKQFLERHNIPTARIYGLCESSAEAHKIVDSTSGPVVLKADGLCAGKGVLVTESADEAHSFVARAMERHDFGEGGDRLLIEEALPGRELSYIILCDSQHFVPLVPTRDHKRAFDADQGPNTGGMGAYSADGIIPSELEQRILQTIVRPTFRGLAEEGHIYRGFLYFGLMLTTAGPKVLEFNCRLGDPETQPIVARVDFDLAEALMAAAEGQLHRVQISWKAGASICVVMASGGYPGKFETGFEITGLEEAEAIQGVVLFHAGTRRQGKTYYTCSGRVLGVTATGPTLDSARAAAYQAVKRIRFQGAHYRTDIAVSSERAKVASE